MGDFDRLQHSQHIIICGICPIEMFVVKSDDEKIRFYSPSCTELVILWSTDYQLIHLSKPAMCSDLIIKK